MLHSRTGSVPEISRLMVGILYNLAMAKSYFGSHAIQENAFETMVMDFYTLPVTFVHASTVLVKSVKKHVWAKLDT